MAPVNEVLSALTQIILDISMQGTIARFFRASMSHRTTKFMVPPVYWNGPQGAWIYIWPDRLDLKAYALVRERFQTNPVSHLCNYHEPERSDAR